MKKTIALLAVIVTVSTPIAAFAGVSFSFGSSPTYNLYSSSASYGQSSFGQTSGSYSTQCSSTNLTLCSLINRVVGYLDQVLFLLIALSIVVFVYYIFKYFIQPNENRSEAGKYVMYSVIGFFVILSMWGLVNILQNTFGVGNSNYAPSSWSSISSLFPTN
jgi:hypothetical protein